MKISREGIVLIKSFEGFRPRAIQRQNGGWIIGYGHTLSAREGATVSEADAELLLRYDLLPVEKSVNETVPAALNQHQFDAVVSFAFSLGLERFASSDVLARLSSGTPDEAADAMMGWPEPQLRETALRRRAAERALFIADPATPVALSDLLAAPVPAEVPPAEAPADPLAPAVDPTESNPVEPVLPDENSAPQPTVPVGEDASAAPDSRRAAVAALLGEIDTHEISDVEQAPVIPMFSSPELPDDPFVVAEEARSAEIEQPLRAEVKTDAVEGSAHADEACLTDPETPADTVLPEQAPDILPDVAAPADPEAVQDSRAPSPELPPAVDPVAMSVARYTPYSATMVGPLPYLQPAAPRLETQPTGVPAIPATEAALINPDAPDVVDETPPASVATTSPAPAADAPVEANPGADARIVAPRTTPDPGRSSAGLGTMPPGVLVLTPTDATSEPTGERPLWTPEQRGEPVPVSETGLFGEDLMLGRGGAALLRHEVEPEAPVRFDWSETGPFVFMGGVGLVSFGASMAAFRRAAEQAGGDELTIIGWVLALIGLACVGVSSFKLYRHWGLPGGD